MNIYLMQRGGAFYFRRAVPFDLREFFPCKEIWRTLKTRDKRAAKARAGDISSETEKIFVLIRSGVLSRQEIERAVKEYFRRILDGFERHRLKGSTLYEVAFDSPIDSWTWQTDLLPLSGAFPDTSGGNLSEAGISQLIEYYTEKVRGLKKVLSLRYINTISESRTNIIIRQLNLSIPEYSSIDENGYQSDNLMPTEFRELCFELLKAEISAYQIEIERLKGNYDNSYDSITNKLAISDLPGLSDLGQKEPVTTLKVTHAIDKYMEHLRSEGGRKDITLLEYKDACNLLPRILGDKNVSDLTRDDIRLYLSTAKKLPLNLNKNPNFKGKFIQDILKIAEQQKYKTLSDSAIQKKFQAMKSFLAWARQEGFHSSDFSGIEFRPDRKAKRINEEREAYTEDDIKGLIHGLKEEDKKGTFDKNPERFWIPLIALFSGMRLEEICQLLVADITPKGDIWCFDVTPYDDKGNLVKELKTGNAKRLIPIHSQLIELGFLQFVNNVRDSKSPRLWIQLKRTVRGKYQRNFSDWYNGADKRPGFENLYIDKSPRKSFHSLRHTFINKLKMNEVNTTTINELVGHSHGSLALDRYGKELPPDIKKAAIEKITFNPIDFTELVNLVK